MGTANETDKWMKLCHGDHSCLLYRNLDEYRTVAVDFIIEGLVNNEMVVGVIDEYPKDLLVKDLRDKGIEVENFIDSGQLMISSIKDIYVGNEGFVPDQTIRNTISNFDEVKDANYNGIRAIGEAIFALDGKQESIDKLIEYEIKYNIKVIPSYKNQTYLCVYNKKLFKPSVLEEIIKAHPVIINDGRLIKPNPYYQDSDTHLKEYYEKKSLRNFFDIEKYDNLCLTNKEKDKETKDIEILKHVLAATGDGVWELDFQSKQVYWSTANIDMSHIEEKECHGSLENVLKIIHPEDVIELNKKIDKCYNNQIDHLEHEIRVIGKDGEIAWAMVKGITIKKDEVGQVIKMVGIFNNITESKNTNIELTTILKATADAIIVVNENEEIIHFNQKFVDMWDIPREILKERNNKIFIEYVKNKLTDPEGYIRNIEEMHKINKDKVETLQLVDGRVIERFYKPFKSNGKDGCRVCSFRDISERKRAEKLEQEIVLKQKELQEVRKYEQLKTEFFSTISHELKTPLNVIFAATQILDSMRKGIKGNENQNSEKYIKIMKQNCYRLIRIINNLIDINRLEAGFMKMELKNYNIVSVVENIALSVVDYANSKNLSIIFDTDTEEKIMACDVDKIERVILNLLSNSVKFTEEGGIIEVNIYDRGETIIISVKDNGIGIPDEMIGEIFERFKQVDSSLSRKVEGSGIGLSLVRSVVELHGGSIKVESQLGKGSEFIIELPVTFIEEEEYSYNEVASTSDSLVERTLIEFSDIYS